MANTHCQHRFHNWLKGYVASSFRMGLGILERSAGWVDSVGVQNLVISSDLLPIKWKRAGDCAQSLSQWIKNGFAYSAHVEKSPKQLIIKVGEHTDILGGYCVAELYQQRTQTNWHKVMSKHELMSQWGKGSSTTQWAYCQGSVRQPTNDSLSQFKGYKERDNLMQSN